MKDLQRARRGVSKSSSKYKEDRLRESNRVPLTKGRMRLNTQKVPSARRDYRKDLQTSQALTTMTQCLLQSSLMSSKNPSALPPHPRRRSLREVKRIIGMEMIQLSHVIRTRKLTDCFFSNLLHLLN